MVLRAGKVRGLSSKVYEEVQVIYTDPDFVKNDRSGRWRDTIGYAMPAIGFLFASFFLLFYFRCKSIGTPWVSPV